MSEALYNNLAGLRFWNQKELQLRDRIKSALVECVQNTLLDINQMWAFEEVETPLMMPVLKMSDSYDRSDIFILQDPPGGSEAFALRPETTNGTFAIAKHILMTTNRKPPFCVYQMGNSFRRETSDGATAAKLRFNAFNQLEFQCIYSNDTKVDFFTPLRKNLCDVVGNITNSHTTLISSDRLPNYSLETIDIQSKYNSNDMEVASTSKRIDFPQISGTKACSVFEIAFGMDRLVAITMGKL
jgi:glycyl-tRNA synthetase